MNSYKEILTGLKKNDYRLQMQFYDMFAEITYQGAFAILGNGSEAEEIMQDTMLKALTRTSLMNEDETQMRKILRRIAVNAAIDVMRKRKSYFGFEEIENITDCTDEESLDENMPTVENIRQAIDSLALGYRTILVLRLFENMNFDEISGQLKISQATARSQYSRALMKLRNYLKNNINKD
ncbi:MAG: sigma-70 family RNA polymerase sigma factor [Prevotellaceae bacterium]|jgi:RNA polymerase sigma-70 factor (ECF subfamily)|nr:sigma-70 family RNA polymerase sigma factor [Prevotellaceae bacterium]